MQCNLDTGRELFATRIQLSPRQRQAYVHKLIDNKYKLLKLISLMYTGITDAWHSRTVQLIPSHCMLAHSKRPSRSCLTFLTLNVDVQIRTQQDSSDSGTTSVASEREPKTNADD